MANLLYLGDQDFYLDKNPKTNNLVVCTTQKDVIFVMFHADQGRCSYCEAAKPEFLKLAQIIQGAKFGLCNLSRFEGLVQKSMSPGCLTPLNKVPLFILFVKGRPFLNYTGEKTLKHFAEFMQKALLRLQEQQVFNQQGNVQTMSAEAMERTPHGLAYDYDYTTVTNSSTIGQITCSDEGVCYLTSKECGLGGCDVKSGGSQQQPPPQQSQQQSFHAPSNVMNQGIYQQHSAPTYQVQQQQMFQPQQPNTYQQQRMNQPYYPPQQQQQQQQQQPRMTQPYYPPQQQQQQYYPPQQQQPQYYQQQQQQPQYLNTSFGY